MNKVIICLALLFFMSTAKLSAYKVYPSSGHQCVEAMNDASNYPFVATHADGIWMMPWNWRNALDNAQQNKIVSNFTSKEMVCEIEIGHFRDTAKGFTFPKQLDYAIEAGAKVHTLMVYKEPKSILNKEEMQWVINKFGEQYKLIVSIRRWMPEYLEVIKMADGLSFEFQVPAKYPVIWEHVAQAVKWCIDNNRPIYLLSPPGHKNYHLNNAYYQGYKDLLNYLVKELGEDYVTSNLLIFAPANYNIAKTQINMCPEWETNTTMGVSKYLLEHELYKK